MRALVLAFLLAACAPAGQDASDEPTPTSTPSAQAALDTMPEWENARAEGVDFRAVGQEPGWLLDIYVEDRIVLVWDYGENRIELPRGEPSHPQEGLTRYETRGGGHGLTVSIRRFPCSDAMSGEAFPAAVEVVIDGRTLDGCGRSV